MSRYNPGHFNAAATLAAAAVWRDRCFADNGSIFTDQELWTEAGAQSLVTHFNENPDPSKDTFLTKLHRQLTGAPTAAIKLMAEMLWILNLFPSNLGPEAKRRPILEIWRLSGDTIDPGHPMLADHLLLGLGSAGPGFLAHRWREVRFLINLTAAAKALAIESRLQLIADPWTFATWVDEVPDEGYRQLRQILPYLLFPDSFERFSSSIPADLVLLRLGGLSRLELSEMSRVERDQAVLALRAELEADEGGPIDFYEPKFITRWSPEPTRPTTAGQPERPPADEASPEILPPTAPLNQIFYGPPGTGKTHRTIDEAVKILDPVYSTENADNRAALKSRFDALTVDGRICFITFHQSFSYEDFVEGLKAEVRPDGSIRYYVADGVFKAFCSSVGGAASRLAGRTFAGGYRVQKSTDEILWLVKPNGAELAVPWAILNELKQLVLNGKISIADIRDKRVFERVPDTRMGKFILHGYNNVFPHLIEALVAVDAERAPLADQITPAGRRVVIIDEINRGNVSKIFGELITLIEPSKRAGQDEALSTTLPYSKTRFEVPDDVFIIGTMNTADRSLSSIDIALRRRFVFEEIEPNPAVLEEIEVEGVNLGKLLERINERIELLLDRDHRIGHSYFMGVAANGAIGELANVFRRQIMPLLQEYFFEDWSRIRLVLNDHKKPARGTHFIVERDQRVALELGMIDAGSPAAKIWDVNSDAFWRPEAYLGTIGNDV